MKKVLRICDAELVCDPFGSQVIFIPCPDVEGTRVVFEGYPRFFDAVLFCADMGEECARAIPPTMQERTLVIGATAVERERYLVIGFMHFVKEGAEVTHELAKLLELPLPVAAG